MPLNKIMHEIGHTLGLIHEHQRGDIAGVNDPMVQTCHRDVPYYGKGGASSRRGHVHHALRPQLGHALRVQHARRSKNVPAGSQCNIGNDNGSTGLSTYDRLTLRILYPHRRKVAEYIHATVIAAGERLKLSNEWGALGALTANVIRNSHWVLKRGNTLVTTQNSVDFDFTDSVRGRFSLSYAFKDMRGHGYVNTIAVKVMAPAAITALPGVDCCAGTTILAT